jgi:choline transport protein
MPRQFSTLSTLAIAFLLTSSWIGYGATFPYPLAAGGGPGVFWGLLIAAFACSVISECTQLLVCNFCLPHSN